jgi:hypothetical protein
MFTRRSTSWLGFPRARLAAALAALAGLVTAGPLDLTAPPGSTGKNVTTCRRRSISRSYARTTIARNGCGSQTR